MKRKRKISTDKQIYSTILKIVNDHSGGIKFTELLTILWVDYKFFKEANHGFPELVEKIIRESGGDELKILDYEWKDCNRVKMFVYTPTTLTQKIAKALGSSRIISLKKQKCGTPLSWLNLANQTEHCNRS